MHAQAAKPPDWTGATRFFVPNEDAAVARMALALLPTKPQRLLAVTGSGMTALDLLPELPLGASMTCIDLSAFQKNYLRELLATVRAAENPAGLQGWLRNQIVPRLNAHYRSRGQSYSYDKVLRALRELFRIRFFFDARTLAVVRARLSMVKNLQGNLLEQVAGAEEYDFVHLSNIVDYLSPEERTTLFGHCARKGTAIFCIQTTACPDPQVLISTWQTADFAPHPGNESLNAANRALGTHHPTRPWMRPGNVYLLLPPSKT